MKQVQFYVLTQDNIYEQACDLAAKAWRLGKRVLIACETEQQAFEIDERLWAREPDSFVPHNLSGEVTQYATPIEISWKGKRNAQRRDLLISLQQAIPEYVASFTQVIEFVPIQETEKAQARERYKQYRQMGWQLSTETLA
ncbi:DNA polymerase III subunit chi [Actinobacillus minor]|uniref:DNA polymerase III subunit chi n=1 Tax=Actinobacillus minor NM305 TaxID=637911 RepID=C5S132_9PAST|nr:DNA polymerase III subunit chi [Actinobacillus minor]EER47263.1 DNA polymerase III subunit chi [Actinobacillus minor NM305]MDD6911246.1 DNA polymerase III subunit chi [Actinobacillus minor]MDY4712591.1 DNA polymerase III subunit chi [Actinobacillus minor]